MTTAVSRNFITLKDSVFEILRKEPLLTNELKESFENLLGSNKLTDEEFNKWVLHSTISIFTNFGKNALSNDYDEDEIMDIIEYNCPDVLKKKEEFYDSLYGIINHINKFKSSYFMTDKEAITYVKKRHTDKFNNEEKLKEEVLLNRKMFGELFQKFESDYKELTKKVFNEIIEANKASNRFY